MKVICYPQDKKQKSLDVCEAFAQGCDGLVVRDGHYRRNCAAMFYGVHESNEEVWQACQRREVSDWFYSDNSYFDAYRGTYFRVGKNCLQPSVQESDGSRFKKLDLSVKPWRRTGSHVLLCPQSEHFMRVVISYPGGADGWVQDTLQELRKYTDRELRVRLWNRNKKELAQQLPAALKDAWALVAYSSASAISAIMMGIPAISTADDCIARSMCGNLSTIEDPLMPERHEWLHSVADKQWTLEEFRDGTAWRALQ